MKLPFFLLITLPGSPRRENAIKRLNHLGLDFGIIDAVPANSEEVERVRDGWTDPHEYKVMNTEIACLISHLKALRYIREYKLEEAIILEDDAVFRNNFTTLLNDKLVEMRKFPLVMLNRYITDWKGIKFTSSEGLYTITKNVYSATGYYIKHTYALEALILYDKPFIQLNPSMRMTSEAITIYSDGVFFNEPLIIEECKDSNINGNLHCKIPYYKTNDLRNFVELEREIGNQWYLDLIKREYPESEVKEEVKENTQKEIEEEV